MSDWMHVELNFRNHNEIKIKLSNNVIPFEKPQGIYIELIAYLKKMVDSLSDLINRYFFLFEDNPHLFLAIEVKDVKDIDLIEKKINLMEKEKPDFIESVKPKRDTEDGEHKEPILDFFHTTTKYAFFRIGNDYNPKDINQSEHKIAHCFCNQLFCDWHNEIFFYSACAEARAQLLIEERKKIAKLSQNKMIR